MVPYIPFFIFSAYLAACVITYTHPVASNIKSILYSTLWLPGNCTDSYYSCCFTTILASYSYSTIVVCMRVQYIQDMYYVNTIFATVTCKFVHILVLGL